MALDETQVFETLKEQIPPRKQGWGEAGPGRPVGRKNNTTLAQKAFAARVLGEPGTPEFDEFVISTRKQLLAGVLAPAITALILHYAYGKPKETIEVEGTVTVEKIVREVIDVIPQHEQLDAVH